MKTYLIERQVSDDMEVTESHQVQDVSARKAVAQIYPEACPANGWVWDGEDGALISMEGEIIRATLETEEI